MTRIIGIDPGSRVTGYGLVDVSSRKMRYVTCGCIHTKSVRFPERLKDIFRGVEQLIANYRVEAFAIENVFVSRNPDSALKLGQARGAAIAAGVVHNLPVSEYASRSVKLAVVGTGRATKEQIQKMVRLILSLDDVPATDAADALAIAICHVHSKQACL